MCPQPYQFILEVRRGTSKHNKLLVCPDVCRWQGNLFSFGSSTVLLSFKLMLRRKSVSPNVVSLQAWSESIHRL